MTLLTLFLILIALLFFAVTLTGASFRLRENTVASVGYLVAYLGFGLAAYLFALAELNHFRPILNAITYSTLVQLALLGLILNFGGVILSFLQVSSKTQTAYLVGAASMLLLQVLLALNLWDIGISGPTVALGLTWLGWIGASGIALGALVSAYKNQKSTKYLNRLRYLIIAAALHAAGGIVLLIRPDMLYQAVTPLLLVGAGLTSYIILSYRTPDLNRLFGQTLQFVFATIFIASILYLGLAIEIIINRNLQSPAAMLIWTIFMAIVLALIVPPLWKLINRALNNIVFGTRRRDERNVIRHFSRSISSALDMQRLGDILTSLMADTLDVEQGLVLVNERGATAIITLRPLSTMGITNNISAQQFAPDSPFFTYFRQDKKFVHQYDIDVLPDFKHIAAGERAWLTKLRMELYVPIARYGEIMGMLAFGQRAGGAAYYPEDIDLMVALADQAVLAMESARLFQQLASINQEIDILNEQLFGLDQNKSDFLSIASHELRTPLTHIHGYSRMLLDLTEEETRDINYVKTIVSGIAKGSERLKTIIDMIFDVTEANVGDLNLLLGPVNLQETLSQAYGPFLTALDERRIAFDRQGIDDLPVIQADGGRLVQALENLFSNAIKYTPDGGLITLRGAIVVLDNIGSAVEIMVADTGIGIDPENHDRIFEKFFRVDDTAHHSTGRTKFKGAGPGLGLTLVKGIAEAHGGKVWVESPGYNEETCPGSKFFFVLPLHPITDPGKTSGQRKQSQIETIHWRNKDLKS